MGGTVFDWHSGVSRAFAAAGATRAIQGDWAALTNEYRRRSLRKIVGAEHPSYNMTRSIAKN